MSIINILWVKDGKPGHEKQVKILLEELSKTLEIKVHEFNCPEKGHLSRIWQTMELYGKKYKHLAKFANENRRVKLNNLERDAILEKDIEIVIGAGSRAQLEMLRFKEYFEYKQIKKLKIISVLSPSIHKGYFDVICAPEHDNYKFHSKNNVILYKGALAKVSNVAPIENIGFLGIGGKNKHYVFNENKLLKQIEYLITLYPNKEWNLFTSRRTPKKIIKELNKLSNDYPNLFVGKGNIDEIIENASIKVVTQDSVSMVFECLSTKGSTYVFNMKYYKKNKIVKLMNSLLENQQVGYIDYSPMAGGLKKIKIINRNEHYDVFAEVEKVAYALIKKLSL